MNISRLSIFFLFPFKLFAQQISPDPGFGDGGIANYRLSSGNDRINCSAPGGNGSVVVAGNFLRKTQDIFVMKILPNGEKDPLFGGGVVRLDVNESVDNVFSIAALPDGKFLLAGETTKSGVTKGLVYRLLANGQTDPSFGTFGILTFNITNTTNAYTSVNAIRLMSDGKFCLAGTSYTANKYQAFVQRRNADGTLDGSFGSLGTALVSFSSSLYSYGWDIFVQADGSVLLYGQQYISSYLISVAKFTSAGLPDNGFGVAGKTTLGLTDGQHYPTRIFVNSAGKVRLIGYANSSSTDFRIFQVSLNADGTYDTGFGSSGAFFYNSGNGYHGAYAAEILSDGTTLIAGEIFVATQYRGLQLLLLPDGSPSTTYGGTGFRSVTDANADSYFNAVCESASGKAVFAGAQMKKGANAFISFTFGSNNANGALDPAFGNLGKAYFRNSRSANSARRIWKSPAGKFYCSGSLQQADADLFLARLKPGSGLDSSFQGDGIDARNFSGPDVFCDQISLNDSTRLCLFSSGEITYSFAGIGNFTGPRFFGMTSFNPELGLGSGFFSSSNSVSTNEFQVPVAAAADQRGRIFVAVKGQQPSKNSGFITRWTNAAVQDLSFGTGGKQTLYTNAFNNEQEVRDIETDAEGNLYVLQYLALPVNNLAGIFLVKRDSNYVPVPSFGTAGECKIFDAPLSAFNPGFMVLNNGGIFVAGKKGSVSAVCRISASGQLIGHTLFSDFSQITKLLFNSDGSVLVLGYGGTGGAFRMVRMLADGNIDASFNGSGFFSSFFFGQNPVVADAFIENGGASIMVIAETFGGDDGSSMNILRLSYLTTGSNELSAEEIRQPVLYPNPASAQLHLSNPGNVRFRLRIFDLQGREMGAERVSSGDFSLDVKDYPRGTYVLHLDSGREQKQLKFVKE